MSAQAGIQSARASGGNHEGDSDIGHKSLVEHIFEESAIMVSVAHPNIWPDTPCVTSRLTRHSSGGESQLQIGLDTI